MRGRVFTSSPPIKNCAVVAVSRTSAILPTCRQVTGKIRKVEMREQAVYILGLHAEAAAETA